jgi:DNA-binding IclR family transcriptional regulator
VAPIATKTAEQPVSFVFPSLTKRDFQIKSALRVLEIFELFRELRRPLSTEEIALTLDYPYSSTAALVKLLVQEGYLSAQGRPKRFIPTLRVTALGNWASEKTGRNGYIFQSMESIHQKTGLNVALQYRVGIRSQLLYFINSDTHAAFHVKAGLSRLLTSSAAGSLIMAGLDDLEIRRIIKKCNAHAPTLEGRVDASTALRRIGEIRETGYVFVQNATVHGSAYLGVPLKGSSHEAPMALGVGGTAAEVAPYKSYLVEGLARVRAELESGREI